MPTKKRVYVTAWYGKSNCTFKKIVFLLLDLATVAKSVAPIKKIKIEWQLGSSHGWLGVAVANTYSGQAWPTVIAGTQLLANFYLFIFYQIKDVFIIRCLVLESRVENLWCLEARKSLPSELVLDINLKKFRAFLSAKHLPLSFSNCERENWPCP